MADTEGIESILALSRSFEVSRAVGAAAKLKLFTALGTASFTAQQVSQALALCQAPGFRGAMDWLDLLTSVGLVYREGESKGTTMRHGIRLALQCPTHDVVPMLHHGLHTTSLHGN